jgi:hypothetical protein
MAEICQMQDDGIINSNGATEIIKTIVDRKYNVLIKFINEKSIHETGDSVPTGVQRAIP